jgi:hypothetical protein
MAEERTNLICCVRDFLREDAATWARSRSESMTVLLVGSGERDLRDVVVEVWSLSWSRNKYSSGTRTSNCGRGSSGNHSSSEIRHRAKAAQSDRKQEEQRDAVIELWPVGSSETKFSSGTWPSNCGRGSSGNSSRMR